MKEARSSIRARLLVLLLGSIAVVWAVLIARTWIDARHEVNEIFDAQLAQSAKILLAQASHDVRELRDAEHARERFEHTLEHPYEQQVHFQIRDERGQVLYRSSSDVPLDAFAPGSRGYADRTLHGERWRVFVLSDAEAGLQIEMCQSYSVREELATAVVRNMLLPFAIALPLLGALIWLATRHGIRPLARLENEFRSRRPDDLRAVDARDVPRELMPLVDSVNDLLEKLQARFETERRFTSDAAHELRTPLAALRTQTQVALAARNPAEREHALQQIVRGIDRTTHLVEQLLTLARVDPDHAAEAQQSVDLNAVIAATASELAPLAAERGIDLRTSPGGSVVVSGNPTLLGTLLRNLVENAIRYSEPGDSVDLSAERLDERVRLVVADSGPGVPPGDRERIFERFARLGGARGSGSGLGLSIVKRIAELHGARLETTAGEGGRGLRVTVTFRAEEAASRTVPSTPEERERVVSPAGVHARG